MFIRTISISLLSLLAASLFAQVPKPDDLPKLAEEVIKERELASKDLEVQAAAAGFFTPDINPYMTGDSERLFAYAMSPVRPKDTDAKAYRIAVERMLHASDPKLVGLACQIAGLSSDFEFLQRLSALADDSRPTVVCQIGGNYQGSNVRVKPVYRVPTVQQLALAAIADITYLQFADKAQFDAWYKDFPHRTKRFWYWRSVWQNRQGVPFYGLEYKKLIGRLPDAKEPYFISDAAFQKLDGRTQLKVLLGFHYYEAIDYETSELLGKVDQSSRRFAVLGTSSGPGMMLPTSALIDHIKNRNLKQVLIGMFEKPDPAKTPWGYPVEEVRQAISLYSNFADKTDLPRLSKLQDKWKQNQTISEQVAIVRSNIEPENGKQILSEVFALFPKSGLIAEKLAERYFDSSMDPILQYYRGLDKWEIDSFCRHIKSISEKGTIVPIGFFKALLSKDASATEVFPRSCLADLAVALNRSLGKEAIATDLIEAATYFNGKVSRQVLEEKNKGHSEAVVKLKEAMMAALASEKTN